jgi:hypothetical protein
MDRRKPISDFALEQYVLGEAPLEIQERIERELALEGSGGPIALRINAIKSSNQEILSSYPPEQIAQQIRNGASLATAVPLFKRREWVAAAAMLFLLVVPTVFFLTPAEERSKGNPLGLTLYKKTNAGSRKLLPGDPISPGDELQMGYSLGARTEGALLSIDGANAVVFHLPATDHSTSLEAGSEVLAPNAVRIDGTPGFETFLIITASKPFNPAAVASRILLAQVSDQISGQGSFEGFQYVFYRFRKSK